MTHIATMIITISSVIWHIQLGKHLNLMLNSTLNRRTDYAMKKKTHTQMSMQKIIDLIKPNGK